MDSKEDTVNKITHVDMKCHKNKNTASVHSSDFHEFNFCVALIFILEGSNTTADIPIIVHRIIPAMFISFSSLHMIDEIKICPLKYPCPTAGMTKSYYETFYA